VALVGLCAHLDIVLNAQIAQKTISDWGLPWTFRFLAGMMLIIGTVSPSRPLKYVF
jgi:hypothetical protein